jgi:hypothetical protein
MAGELAQALTPGSSLHVGSHMKVALVERLLIMHPIARDLAVDGGRMAVQALGNHSHGDLSRAQAVNLAALRQGQMSIGQGHTASVRMRIS